MNESRPWLLVIDPQVIFADPVSAWAAPRFPEAMEVIEHLAPGFGERVLVTRWLADPNPRGSWATYFQRWPFAAQPASDHLFDLMPAAAGLSTHPTLDCFTFSKWGPQLQGLVGPSPQLVLTGVSTDCCVLATALAATDGGATVTVVADACAASCAENHAAGLHVMRQYEPQIRVLDSAAFAAEAGLPHRSEKLSGTTARLEA